MLLAGFGAALRRSERIGRSKTNPHVKASASRSAPTRPSPASARPPPSTPSSPIAAPPPTSARPPAPRPAPRPGRCAANIVIQAHIRAPGSGTSSFGQRAAMEPPRPPKFGRVQRERRGSRRLRKCAPLASSCSMTASRWLTERARRSSRTTTTPGRMSRRRGARIGRLGSAPEACSSSTLTQPAARSSSR